MIPVHSYKGKHVAVFGLGRNGLATARALMLGGAHVTAWDDNKKGCNAAAKQKVPVDDLYDADWTLFDCLVVSPGVPLTHPKPHKIVKKAQKADVEIVGDVELFAREIDQIENPDYRPRVVAITGTNGKSTTTSLIAHMLQKCGVKAIAGGNLGDPILSLPALERGRVYVLELSSYQLDLTTRFQPNVSVLLNLSPDHLDRHGDMDGYISAKKRIFQNQSPDDLAVIGVDDSYGRAICTEVSATDGPDVTPIAVGKTLGQGVYVINAHLYDGVTKPCQDLVDLEQASTLQGKHNWQNVAAAYAVGRYFTSDHQALAKALLSFPGLAHRMEVIGTWDNVQFVNDSKATNAEAVSHALSAFENIHWIAGGLAKDGGIDSLAPCFPRIKQAYLIGKASKAFAKTLGKDVPHVECGELAEAVVQATAAARAAKEERSVVLLSPACASQDQFQNFEERGDAFRTLVTKIMNGHNSSPNKESAA